MLNDVIADPLHPHPTSSVASFLVLGGQDPQMYRQKKKLQVNYMRERAKRANASETYIFRSPKSAFIM